VHDLSFRAATAIFGHLGIEWDLTKATDQELADLRDWISFYKANRPLLMGGDLVRVDFPDPAILAYGIIAADRSAAIYTVASIGTSDVTLPGRLRFPRLDPDRRYRIRPILVGHPPPAWIHRPGGEPPLLSSNRQANAETSAGACPPMAAMASSLPVPSSPQQV
jgi:alpha-galactosidase